jgi:hypothetical protein
MGGEKVDISPSCVLKYSSPLALYQRFVEQKDLKYVFIRCPFIKPKIYLFSIFHLPN